jgi:anti-sigma regulatory factor (Ser/Thr protein kinase)
LLEARRLLDISGFPQDHLAMSALEMIEILRGAPEEEIRLVRNAADALLAASGIQADEISEIESACAEGLTNYRSGDFFTSAQMKERLSL